MSMRSSELQAAYVRRREIEHMRNERNDALNRYYDNFDKLNSRFANWSGPEYYQKAEERMTAQRKQQEKRAQLQQRQDKLKEIFAKEQQVYEVEIKERSKPRARRIPASNEQLAEIERNLKEREQIKRKLEMEAKLYGRMRHGVDDEHRIFDAKSDNEVLAKLNWLDKQIEDQMEREKEQSIMEDRKLRMQQEMRKVAETKKQRQEIREKEIKEIRALQERHMNELKERQSESSLLKNSEHELRLNLTELDKEMELLDESSSLIIQDRGDSDSSQQSHNLKRIKLVIRKRSEAFRQQIKMAINILERMRKYSGQPDKVKTLLEKCQDEMELEECILSQIEGMYDSEAKYSLQQLEAMWRKQHIERYKKLKDLIKDEQSTLSAQLNENMQRQTDIIEVRSTHLSSIESSSEKLKQLVLEERNDAKEMDDHCEIEHLDDVASTLDGKSLTSELGSKKSELIFPSRGKSASMANVSNSFTNLNLDVWQDLPSTRRGIDTPRLQSTRSMSVVTADNVEKPKFGRKRVAWT